MNNLLSHLTKIDFSNATDFSEKDLENRAILIGVVAEIILSKKLHNKNEKLREFIYQNFKIELGDYLYKSRTLLLSRIIRLIESSDKNMLNNYSNSISLFLTNMSNDSNNKSNSEETPQKKSKRKSTLDSIDSWRKVISGENV